MSRKTVRGQRLHTSVEVYGTEPDNGSTLQVPRGPVLVFRIAAKKGPPGHDRCVHTPLVLLFALAAVLLGAGPASAEDGYRYWNYSHLEGEKFVFAETGPGEFVPENGVGRGLALRHLHRLEGHLSPRRPLEVTFTAVCGDTQPKADEKRVAVLVDHGTTSDADGAEVPEARAACATVPQDANGLQTLESVVEVRSEKSMICALDGYPAPGCGTPVGDAKVATDEATIDFALPGSDDLRLGR